jgi:hypothetical protein
MPQTPFFTFRNLLKQIQPAQVDNQLAIWESARHGRNYAAAYGAPAQTAPVAAAVAGASFMGASQVTASLSVGLAATYTGLCLNNPAASGLNLSVKEIAGLITSAVTGQIGLGLIIGWAAAGVTVHTTPLDTDILAAYVGAAATGTPPVAGPASIAHLDAACTLVGTPLFAKWFVANGAANACTSFLYDAADGIIIPPGGYIAIGSPSAQGGFLGSFAWEEIKG